MSNAGECKGERLRKGEKAGSGGINILAINATRPAGTRDCNEAAVGTGLK